ncbi:MAG: ABC transporter permease subunit [Candidatus Kapabacteria bacterium]|nr:ABC transporter permease subunit [Candidatus Kapabacteria bacterium]
MADITIDKEEIDPQTKGSVIQSLSINQRRWRRFKSLKRGYYSLIILIVLYFISFFLPVLINNKPLYVSYKDKTYFPAFRDLGSSLPLLSYMIDKSFVAGEELGEVGNKGNANYRKIQESFDKDNSGTIVMPFYPYDPLEDISTDGNVAFLAPFEENTSGSMRILGTDDRGRDVLSRMSYGFQVSLSFALLLAFIEYVIGIIIGGTMGYWGGWFDVVMQRFKEIWSTLPMLFIIIIVVSITTPNFVLLVALVALTGWIGISSQMRAQFYREKARDYVAAAVSMGASTKSILFKHILPNSLVPVITYLPFTIVGSIGYLVSLDFLGFGLQPPTPSWGQMIGVGLQNLSKWWLVVVPMSAMAITLIMVVFIGEAIREAFDPRTFSRLR